MALRELRHSMAPSSWPIFLLGTGRRHCNLCIIHSLSTVMYRSRGQPEPTEIYCILDTARVYTCIHLYFSSFMFYMQKCNNWCRKCRTNLKSSFLKIPWILEVMLGQCFLSNMLDLHTKQWTSLRLLQTWFSLILLPAFLVLVFYSSWSSSFSPANPTSAFLSHGVRPSLFYTLLRPLSFLKPHFLLSWSIYNFKSSSAYKRENAMFIWVCLITLSIMISSSVHFPIKCHNFTSSLQLQNILLYMCACMYQIFFVT